MKFRRDFTVAFEWFIFVSQTSSLCNRTIITDTQRMRKTDFTYTKTTRSRKTQYFLLKTSDKKNDIHTLEKTTESHIHTHRDAAKPKKKKTTRFDWDYWERAPEIERAFRKFQSSELVCTKSNHSDENCKLHKCYQFECRSANESKTDWQ